MNLKRYLLSRIVMVALLCFFMTTAWLLYHSHAQVGQHTQQMADSLEKHLASQLLLANAGIGQANPFPDFDAWKQTNSQPGTCVAYRALDGSNPHDLCMGAKLLEQKSPAVFESVYQWFFQAGAHAERRIVVHGREFGTLVVTPNAEQEITKAWQQVGSLMGLSGVTVLSVCLLVYLNIHRALHPAQNIVAGLAELEKGQLGYRLPGFELNEWQRIAVAINQLAASQQQLLQERQRLVVKLIGVQEQERQDLSRELHDEFGQCLAAINALAVAIQFTAVQQCPSIVDESERIARIADYMLQVIRNLLNRLRPAELDEFGLAISLNRLVASWNGNNGGNTHYQLKVVGDCSGLAAPQSLALFRIAQEALTNIAKHAAAAQVVVNLHIGTQVVQLTIQDDGIAQALPFTGNNGIGLPGIRERLAALDGQLQLAIAEPHGLILTACLPL